MKDKSLAVQNYKRFCELDGSEYIASEFALETILKIIKIFKVNSILELGLGIGSICDTVLKYSKRNNQSINYFGTEKNEFCLSALKKNVTDYNHIKLFSGLTQIENKKFDLIIIDGYDDALKEILAFCKKNTIIFIEGDRKDQKENIRQIFPKNKYVNVISNNKNKPYSHAGGDVSRYVGGGKLIFINPTLKMKLFWCEQKAGTFIKNRVRLHHGK